MNDDDNGKPPVDPAKGNELLRRLFTTRPLPIVQEPPEAPLDTDHDQADA
jgi:hypothetical protein